MAQRKQFLLRISPELWEELGRWATDEFRSVNGQIEFLLQRAADKRRGRSGREMPVVASPEGPDPGEGGVASAAVEGGHTGATGVVGMPETLSADRTAADAGFVD